MSESFDHLLWVTNHPKSLLGMWPRRAGVVYITGPPKGTYKYTAEELSVQGLVGAYVDMSEEAYYALPLAHNPAELKRLNTSLQKDSTP